MITYMDRVVISCAIPSIQKEFGFSLITMGWILSAFQWGYAIFQIPSGWLGDRFGPQRALTGRDRGEPQGSSLSRPLDRDRHHLVALHVLDYGGLGCRLDGRNRVPLRIGSSGGLPDCHQLARWLLPTNAAALKASPTRAPGSAPPSLRPWSRSSSPTGDGAQASFPARRWEFSGLAAGAGITATRPPSINP